MDRVAVKDDIVPLLHPITTPSGEKLTSLKIKAGQVGLFTFRRTVPISLTF